MVRGAAGRQYGNTKKYVVRQGVARWAGEAQCGARWNIGATQRIMRGEQGEHMSVSVWQTAADPVAPEVVETAVIGAGLIGAYLARRLAERGPVLVLDGRHVAGGASGRNGGLLLSGIAHCYAGAVAAYGRATARELWGITIQNREAMIEWATRLGTPVRRCGSYVLACTAAQSDELRELALLLAADDLLGEWHGSDPLGRGFGAAIWTPDDGAINAALLVAALLRAPGITVREQSEVYALTSQDDGVLIDARGGPVLARRVFIATNAWTPLLLAEFGDLIVPGRGQVIATAPAPRFLDASCYCDDGFEYFQQTPDGRLVLGGFRHHDFVGETTYSDHTTPLIQARLEEFLAAHFPELRGVAIERRWSGTMAFTPDGLPLVGRLRRDERVGFAVGFNGHGLGLGIMAADALLAGDDHLFAARRLMAGAV